MNGGQVAIEKAVRATAMSARHPILVALFSRLCCPHTKGEIAVVPKVIAGGDVMNGLIYSFERGDIVGVVESFKPRFVHLSNVPELRRGLQESLAGVAPHRINEAPLQDILDICDPAIEWIGDWQRLTDYWCMATAKKPGAVATFTARGPFRIQFSAHPHSGFAQVTVGGRPFAEIDLFNPHTAVPRFVDFKEPLPGATVVEIAPLPRKNPESRNYQVIVEQISLQRSEKGPFGYQRIARSRSQGFRPRPAALMKELAPDAFMLDLGGGRRMIDDPRYFNLDYVGYQENDLVADAQNLPFMTGSIDYVHSSAVFEHLPEPHNAAREVHRVLKPGGRAHVITAFMQPVHSEGQHFYNATIWGAENWFQLFENKVIGYDGKFSHTVEWMARVAGIQKKVTPERWKEFEGMLRSFDEIVSRDGLLYVAAEVSVDAVK